MKSSLFLVTTGLFSSLLFSQLASADTLSLACTNDDNPHKEGPKVFVNYSKNILIFESLEFTCKTQTTKDDALRCEFDVWGDVGKEIGIKKDKFFAELQDNNGLFQLYLRILYLPEADGSGGLDLTTRYTCIADK